MQNCLNPLKALNYIEMGGEVLVSLPGCASSVFRLSTNPGEGIERGNTEIGICPGMQPAEVLRHFGNMIHEGGSITLL